MTSEFCPIDDFQKELLTLFLQGNSYRQIGRHIERDEETVYKQMRKIVNALDAKVPVHAAAIALKKEYINLRNVELE